MYARIELTKPTGHVTLSLVEYEELEGFSDGDGVVYYKIMGCWRQALRLEIGEK